MANIFRRPTIWVKQPAGPLAIDWSAPLSSALQFVYTRDLLLARGGGTYLPASRYASNAGVQPSPVGLGYRFSGNVADYVRFDIPSVTALGTDPCTIEFLCYGSNYPSLGGLVGWENTAVTTGNYGAGAGPTGKSRSILSFNSTDPCNIYWFGASVDSDSGVKFQANTVQHIFAVKPASTTGNIVFYRNGVQIASVAGQNSVDTTQICLYLGGGHSSRSATFNGVISKAAVYKTALSAAEIAALSRNPWAQFAPIRRAIFVSGISPVTGTGKAVGGGVVKADGTHAGQGAGKAVGGGVARSSGSTVRAGTGAAVGGGVARSSGTAAKVGTGAAVGGGVARAAGSGSTSPTGTGKAVGGGTAAATGAATKAGVGRAVGGGVARASGFGIRSGTAIAVGGGVAKAAGGVVVPGAVDHYIHGWPANKAGAVIVRIMP